MTKTQRIKAQIRAVEREAAAYRRKSRRDFTRQMLGAFASGFARPRNTVRQIMSKAMKP